MRRVAVTGLGVVAPVGIGIETFWAALAAGTSGIAPITHFDASEFTTRFAGMAEDFDPEPVIGSKEARRMSRFIQFSVVAAAEALADAALEVDDPDGRVGVIYGSGIGGLEVMEEQHSRLVEQGPRRVSPFLVPMMISDLAAGQISIQFGAKGINYCPVSACSTGAHAIGEAGEAIRRGAADVVIAGGTDAAVTPLGLGGFCAARALSTRNDDPEGASRPFDAGRDGFVMGEGAGAVVLEDWDHAMSRGAHIRGELLGYGASADAHHITAPEPGGDGAARAMSAALAQLDIVPADVGYINAHGTSTPQGDAIETAAIKRVFGDTPPPVSSTKSMTGHLLGAAGAVEFVASLLAVERGLLPPTINLEEPDPACDLDYVPGGAREADLDVAISNSFGFGGHNVTLLLGRPRP
jgi:3-oxoacyl-[acyl-carrier-protein] synthase II